MLADLDLFTELWRHAPCQMRKKRPDVGELRTCALIALNTSKMGFALSKNPLQCDRDPGLTVSCRGRRLFTRSVSEFV